MSIGTNRAQISVFSTCCSSKDADAQNYLERVREVAQWSETANCRGILVYADNGLVDPWMVSQAIIEHTDSISPLVAVQPLYMHPFTVAKKVATLGLLYGRQVCLNMIAGGFKNDLAALNDETPHDERYDRLVEYTLIIRALLEESKPLTFQGKYYRVRNLKLHPPLPEELLPEILISGSSEAGLRAAKKTGAIAVKYPEPASVESPCASSLDTGLRIGIIAREEGSQAWKIAEDRFPEDRRGRLTHELAMKISDSEWHRRLSRQEERPGGDNSPYWMRPFHTYQTFCPYLVGSHREVAREISSYAESGRRTFILDIPASKEELEHINRVFALVSQSLTT